jgi:hypothetical protein
MVYRHQWRRQAGVAALASATGMAGRVAAAGIPFVPGVTPNEEAVELLRVAAEIEHALMVEYLYAAYASSNNTLRNSLANIAKQEMGHLMTVQNLILMLGGTPYLGRQDHTPDESEDPFPFRLEPPSKTSVATYATCEAPPEDLVPPAQATSYATARALAASSVPFVNRVGALYAKIYWLFMEDDTSADVWTGFPVGEFASEAGRHVLEPAAPNGDLQSTSDEWPGGVDDLLVNPCLDRRSARAAIFAVAAQGEGGPSISGSHFERFLTAFELTNTAQTPFAHDVPVSPTLNAGQQGTIDNPRAVALVRVGDSLYRLVIIEILLGLTMKVDDPLRAELLDASRMDMTSGLRRIASHLAGKVPRLEGQPPSSSARAAITFTKPTVVDGGDASTLTAAFRAEIETLEGAVDALRATPDNDAVASSMPGVLDAVVAERRDLITRIAGV